MTLNAVGIRSVGEPPYAEAAPRRPQADPARCRPIHSTAGNDFSSSRLSGAYLPTEWIHWRPAIHWWANLLPGTLLPAPLLVIYCTITPQFVGRGRLGWVAWVSASLPVQGEETRANKFAHATQPTK